MFHDSLLAIGTLVALGVLALACLSQRYWFARAWRFAGLIQGAPARKAMRGALLLLVFAVLYAAFAGVTRNVRGTVSRGSWWTAFLGFWLSSSVVSYLFIKIVAGADWVWRRLRSAIFSRAPVPDAPHGVAGTGDSSRGEAIDHSRRRFFHAAGFVAGAIPFVSAAYGFAEERFRYQIREIEIPLANFPRALDGLRITQLSDIHIGSYMPVSQVRRAVGMANELGSDLIVVTGDFLTTRGDPLEDCIAELSRLRAPLGVWGCNGNHEIYANAQAKSAELFQQHGMKLLRQENAEVRWQGTPFNLIGVDYQRQRDADQNRAPMLVGAESLVRHGMPNILLSHNPNSFPRAAELGIELSLAGHTHGGQVRVEILDHRWNPAMFLTPYVAGAYHRPLYSSSQLSDEEVFSPPGIQQVATSTIYVNRGLGTIGAPVRLGVPPEITKITLRCS
ncbi:MAG: metallophosphoesterase [Acidobacteriia bacterium]|nr:metallophosphoesterase [Terriglobia bacterium]